MARVAKALALALVTPLLMAAASDRDQLDLSLDPFGGSGRSGPKLSLGSVGMDSHAGNSYLPAPEDAPYYFMIPSQRPPKKVPGFLFKIPFGSE